MSQGFFRRLASGLSKTREKLTGTLRAILPLGRKLDDAALEEVVEALIAADVGPRAAERIAEHLREAFRDKKFDDSAGLVAYLKAELKRSLSGWDTQLHLASAGPTVILVTGVNGTGKTTSIAKLTYRFTAEGKKVLLAAADTFRAAAIDQLGVWAERLKVDMVRHQPGGDPAAVAFDAVDAAMARRMDVLIVDTAGRLHTKEHLMRELEKIRRVIQKKIPEAPHEVLLVLDATTGQNAISQARLFREAVNVTGIILAKMDGTAKGGIVIGMRDQVDIPVKFIGVGEKVEDLEPFDADDFVEALFES